MITMKTPYKLSALALLSVFVGVCYGVAIAKYQVFPHSVLVNAKSAIISNSSPTTRNKIYQNRVDLLNTFHSNHDVVMFGDSFMEYGNWNDILGFDVANLGIAGDDTAGMLKRINQVLDVNPKLVFITVGINDVDKRVPVERIYENIQKMVHTFSNAGIRVCVNSAVLSGKTKSDRNENISILNSMLSGAQGHDKYEFIDLNNILAPNGIMLPKYSSDDTHINAIGYGAWKKMLLENCPI